MGYMKIILISIILLSLCCITFYCVNNYNKSKKTAEKPVRSSKKTAEKPVRPSKKTAEKPVMPSKKTAEKTELVYYWANWCGICKKTKPEWEKDINPNFRDAFKNIIIKDI